MTGTVLYVGASVIAIVGALAVVLARDVMRLALGLGAFLAAVAGFFAIYGFGFLALAQLFVYVGGVLVLVLFAIMLVHRPQPGSPLLQSRHDPLAFVTCVGFVVIAAFALGPVLGPFVPASASGIESLGAVLLGKMLSHFELAGLLLLAALVAVVAIGRGDS